MSERIPLPLQENTNHGFDQLPEEFTRSESMGAAFDLAWRDTLVGNMAQNSAIEGLERQGGKQLSAEEANAQYPMIKPFTKPISGYVAQHLFDQEQEDFKLQMKIQNGPDDTYTAAGQFGAGILAHAMDPMEQAVSMGVGGFVGGALVKTAWGARVAARAGLAAELPGVVAAPSLASRTAFQTVEAGVGNLVENVGQEFVLADTAKNSNRTYDTDGALTNVLASTFFGTALGVGIKEGSFQMNRVLRNTTPEADLAMARGVVAQVHSEIRPDVEPLAKALAQETDVKIEGYQYEPLTKETLPQKQFFVVSKGPDLATSGHMVVGETYFHGAQMTDNPGVANAASVRSLSQGKGLIHPVELGELNPLDLDQVIPENLRPAFVEALKGVPDVEKLVNGSAKEALDTLREAIDTGQLPMRTLDALQAQIQAAGFNSSVHNGASVAGFEHSPHNVLTVFDQPVAEYSGKLKTVHGSMNEKLDAFGDPKKVNKYERYDSGGGVFGSHTYFAENGDWVAIDGPMETGGRGIGFKTVYGVELNFKRALVVTPKTLDRLTDLLKGVKGEDIPAKLTAAGYDGLIIRDMEKFIESIKNEFKDRNGRLLEAMDDESWGTLSQYEKDRAISKSNQAETFVQLKTALGRPDDWQDQIVSFNPEINAKIAKRFDKQPTVAEVGEYVGAKDQPLVKSKGFHTPDPKLINSPDPEVVRQQYNAKKDYTRDLFFDPEAMEQFAKEVADEEVNLRDPIKEVDDIIAEHKEEYASLEKQGLATAEMKAEIEKLDKIDKLGVDVVTAIKALEVCSRRAK